MSDIDNENLEIEKEKEKEKEESVSIQEKEFQKESITFNSYLSIIYNKYSKLDVESNPLIKIEDLKQEIIENYENSNELIDNLNKLIFENETEMKVDKFKEKVNFIVKIEEEQNINKLMNLNDDSEPDKNTNDLAIKKDESNKLKDLDLLTQDIPTNKKNYNFLSNNILSINNNIFENTYNNQNNNNINDEMLIKPSNDFKSYFNYYEEEGNKKEGQEDNDNNRKTFLNKSNKIINPQLSININNKSSSLSPHKNKLILSSNKDNDDKGDGETKEKNDYFLEIYNKISPKRKSVYSLSNKIIKLQHNNNKNLNSFLDNNVKISNPNTNLNTHTNTNKLNRNLINKFEADLTNSYNIIEPKKKNELNTYLNFSKNDFIKTKSNNSNNLLNYKFDNTITDNSYKLLKFNNNNIIKKIEKEKSIFLYKTKKETYKDKINKKNTVDIYNKSNNDKCYNTLKYLNDMKAEFGIEKNNKINLKSKQTKNNKFKGFDYEVNSKLQNLEFIINKRKNKNEKINFNNFDIKNDNDESSNNQIEKNQVDINNNQNDNIHNQMEDINNNYNFESITNKIDCDEEEDNKN